MWFGPRNSRSTHRHRILDNASWAGILACVCVDLKTATTIRNDVLVDAAIESISAKRFGIRVRDTIRFAIACAVECEAGRSVGARFGLNAGTISPRRQYVTHAAARLVVVAKFNGTIGVVRGIDCAECNAIGYAAKAIGAWLASQFEIRLQFIDRPRCTRDGDIAIASDRRFVAFVGG